MLVKYLTFIYGHIKIQKLFKIIRTLHEKQVKGPANRKEPLAWCLMVVKRASVLQYAMIFGAAIMLWINPITTLSFTDKRELPFGILIVFADHTTLQGFIMNSISQVLMQYVGIVMVATFDSVMIMFVVHTIVFVDLFKLELDEFTELLTQKDKADKEEIKRRLREIVLSHKAILEYFILKIVLTKLSIYYFKGMWTISRTFTPETVTVWL